MIHRRTFIGGLLSLPALSVIRPYVPAVHSVFDIQSDFEFPSRFLIRTYTDGSIAVTHNGDRMRLEDSKERTCGPPILSFSCDTEDGGTAFVELVHHSMCKVDLYSLSRMVPHRTYETSIGLAAAIDDDFWAT